MFVYKVDEEISMRMLAAFDAERLFYITDQSRSYLREWLPWVDETTSVEDTLSFIKHSFQLHAERKGTTAGIFFNKELVGVAGFNSFDWKNSIGYIGYWLASDYQGHGIITRSVQALINYAFDELKLNRIDIRAATENYKSRAIPERLGFSKEGTLKQAEWLYDHYVDHNIYGMVKEDWNKK